MAIFADKRDGKVTGRWRVELQLAGKRLRKRFDTLEQARAYEAKARTDMANGVMPEEAKDRFEKGPKVLTLDDLLRATSGHLWAGTSSERLSHQRLEGAVRILGPSRLVESITHGDTDRLVKVLRDRESAPGTINRYLSALNVALKWALKRGHRISPLPDLEWADEDEGRIRWITPEEEATLVSFLPRAGQLLVFISIRTGMRRGELLGLQPRDVQQGWAHLWGTGTKSGKGRSIPIREDVVKALKELFGLGMPTTESLRYWWATARKCMGLEEDDDFVFHACRHTFATRAVQSNVHPRVLQRLMGHKHLSTTMRYMQVADSMLSDAIDQMNHNGSIDTHSIVGSSVGALQGGVIPINPPLSRPGNFVKTLRKQRVRSDLGSCGETRGGSSPSARTKPKSEDISNT